MTACRSAGLLTTEHSGDLIDSLVAVDRFGSRHRRRIAAPSTDRFGDDDLRVGKGRYLGEMRDDHHLMPAPRAAQALSPRRGGGAADAGIDLVEDERLRCLGQ